MECHRIIFDRLNAASMSGDETDGPKVEHSARYRIVLAEWQSEAFRTFLWRIDTKYIGYWQAPPGKRRTSGNGIRVRVLSPDSRSEPGSAPRGLWRNCYDEAWLAKLKDCWQRDLLEIVDEDYDFSIP
ncbi:hypothetical protein BV20DRAFT_1035643 [Pilatotrama ljubarskyi]|nr:hypothetical protein BV20DRAFT_1035643 [Pilatotrama ljubarskyi]